MSKIYTISKTKTGFEVLVNGKKAAELRDITLAANLVSALASADIAVLKTDSTLDIVV